MEEAARYNAEDPSSPHRASLSLSLSLSLIISAVFLSLVHRLGPDKLNKVERPYVRDCTVIPFPESKHHRRAA